MTLLFGNFAQQKATDAGGDIVKRTHWHIIRKGQILQEPYYSLPAATNAVRGKYPPDQISFTERRTNHCEICRAASSEDTIKTSGKDRKISEVVIHTVRSRYTEGYPERDLMKTFNLSREEFDDILSGKLGRGKVGNVNKAIERQNSKDTIVKVKGGYKVLSESGGKNLGGPYKSKAEAEKRLRQVEYFKHKGN